MLLLTGTANSGCFLLFRAMIHLPYTKRAMAQTIALEGIISCSVFHFHEDTLIFRFHDLRHVFATNALEHGMDVKTLYTIIGHVSSATTLNIYAHVTNDSRTLNDAMVLPFPAMVTPYYHHTGDNPSWRHTEVNTSEIYEGLSHKVRQCQTNSQINKA